ncbi:FHA-domain containing protein [Bifidobacterium stellenboschense]|uniref:FHA-domain containing protein n=1 Tax=Bifidobacterium stellenboschense TaxID=762211 RepID=A0A087D6D1_9BIFI|nr:FHA domain-containing protein [Bifidobacterium stellenboschense]KFI91081.1 FHA-domain containing protein [Bifidobacterium stellenboschense]
MSNVIPFPPAPEPGWYADDPVNTPAAAQPEAQPAPAQQPQSQQPEPQPAQAAQAPASGLAAAGLATGTPVVTGTFVTNQSQAQPIQSTFQPAQQPATQQAQPAQQPQTSAAQDDDEDWDSTVLSSSFTIKQAHKTYVLHNEATGQTILIDRSVLLGRRPSEAIPEGAKAVKIEDPTRTTSRNHAAISIDQDGQLWIEDYGSLNGTFIIRNGEEQQVVKGTPAQLEAPATLRIGDQFFTLEEQQ